MYFTSGCALTRMYLTSGLILMYYLTNSPVLMLCLTSVQDPRDGFGDYHSSSPERSQQRSQQP